MFKISFKLRPLSNFIFKSNQFLPSIYTLSLFHITTIKFYTKKFQYITKQVERFNASSSERTENRNNRKLAKLISDYNLVQLEMMDINSFFKRHFASNLVCTFFAVNILVVRISHLQLVSEDCLSVVDADNVRLNYSSALRAGELSHSSGRVPCQWFANLCLSEPDLDRTP